MGPITVVCVRRFLATEEQERSRVQERHLHKLRLLGLHDNKRVEGTLHNFSSKQLTQAETEMLASCLDYCFYPHRLNILKIKVEFEKTYGEIKRHLAPKHILDFKLKMLNLYNRYISGFFKQRKHHHADMSKELMEVHNSLRNDNSIIVTKPDKGNGVVVLNRTDYVSKMEDILSDASKFSLSSNDDNLQNLTKFQRFLYRLQKKEQP